jgi:hypothetical protein
MVVSTMIPSSLSYSSSCSSFTATSSTNIATVVVPIQVIKTQKNNDNNISTISTSQKGYRYIQKQPQQIKPLTIVKAGNHLQTFATLSVR